VAQVKDAIVERYYQKRAIGSIFSQFAGHESAALPTDLALSQEA
jgi:hypothetical protein